MSAARVVGRGALVTALALGIVPLLSIEPAFACTCVGRANETPAQKDARHFHSARVVFQGVLREVVPAEVPAFGRGRLADAAATNAQRTHPRGVALAAADDGLAS